MPKYTTIKIKVNTLQEVNELYHTMFNGDIKDMEHLSWEYKICKILIAAKAGVKP